MDHFQLKDGVVHCEDVPLPEIGEGVGTPVYVYSTATMCRHVAALKEALEPLPDPLIAYAVKANPNSAVIATLANSGLGAQVTAVDAAPENIEEARLHALGQGLEVDYRVGGVEALDGRYELVTCLEVVEHVAEVRAFVGALAGALAEDGRLILSTPNRTAWSRLVMIGIGEGTGRIPRGTHDWNKFLCPEELCALLRDAGLEVIDFTGLSWRPAQGFCLSHDKSLNYFVTAKRA